MVTIHKKAQCVSWFIETKSDVQTRKRSIITFFNSSMSQKIYGDKKNVGCSEKWRTRTSSENIEGLRRALSRSIKSTSTAARKLRLPTTTVAQGRMQKLTIVRLRNANATIFEHRRV